MLTSRSVFAAAALVVVAFAAIMMASVHPHATAKLVPKAGAPKVVSPSVAPAYALPSAVVGVQPATRSVTLATNYRDVTYRLCAGAAVDLSSVQPGQFANASLSGGCVTKLAVAPPPLCTTAGTGSYTDATWVGANPAAHSVLYQTKSGSRSTLGARWCQAPSALTAGGASMALAHIPPGSAVRVVTSSSGWVTEVIVQHPARSGA